MEITIDHGRARRFAVSNLGWVDHGSVWRFDLGSRQVEQISLGAAKHLVLRAVNETEFSAVHHFDGSRVEITVQSFAKPNDIIRRVVVDGGTPRVDLDLASWPLVVSHFVAWLNDDATRASGYYLISVSDESATIDQLGWFNSASYDLDYQSVIAVSEVPESDELGLRSPATVTSSQRQPLTRWSAEGRPQWGHRECCTSHHHKDD